MKTYIYRRTSPSRSNATKNGQHYIVEEKPDKPVNALSLKAEDIADALEKFKAVDIQQPAKPLRALTKCDLVERLIAAGKAEEFNAFLGSLPLAEKLRWETSPTVSPTHPYIAENKPAICQQLEITSEQFDQLFQ